jgi:phosphatidylserine/phosphatidylglycerophosphate/cardiolipin synthase-like enzyme
MLADPLGELGGYLTAAEARGLAAGFAGGRHVTRVLTAVGSGRRGHVQKLLTAAELDHTDPARAVAVLGAVAGAKAVHRRLTPVWTMPGNEATVGHLTSQFHGIVQGARQSVTCATYNFQRTSQMWPVLAEAAERPGVLVTVYVDGAKADAAAVQAQLPRATVYRSAELASGKRVVSHAKFVVVDHQLVLLTSANFSYSAENLNVEFGLLIHDGGLAESIESVMGGKHGSLYELAGA